MTVKLFEHTVPKNFDKLPEKEIIGKFYLTHQRKFSGIYLANLVLFSHKNHVFIFERRKKKKKGKVSLQFSVTVNSEE
jgi:hypothetical protein